MSAPTSRTAPARGRGRDLGLRALTAAALLVDAGVHLHLAPGYQVALSAFAAVVLYRYVDLPALGPLPAMYEPVWYGEKAASAAAEGAGAVLAGVGLARTRRTRRRAPARS